MRFLAAFLMLVSLISADDRAFFREHGYLWVKNFFSEEDALFLRHYAEEAHKEATHILEYPDATKSLIVVTEAKNPLLACRTEDMLSYYPEFHTFVADKITHYLGEVMGEPYTVFKDKLNFKWPGGGAFTPHQDYPAYAPFGPGEHITVMVSIDRATLENGCLHIGKHWRATFPELPQDKPVLPYVTGGPLHGSIQPEYAKQIEWIALETSPRDLVIFDSFIPHYSEPNHSNHSRRAMFLTHNRMSDGEWREIYFDTKRNDPLNPTFHIGTPTHARGK